MTAPGVPADLAELVILRRENAKLRAFRDEITSLCDAQGADSYVMVNVLRNATVRAFGGAR